MRLSSIVLLFAFLAPYALQAQENPALDEQNKIAESETRQLEEFLTETSAAALAVTVTAPLEERRARSRTMRQEMYNNRVQTREAVRQIFDALVMRPESIEPVRDIITDARYALKQTSLHDEPRLLRFFERLYSERSRTGSSSASAVEWQEGYAQLLVNLGRYAEARGEMQQVVRKRGDELRPHGRALAAVIEHLNGDGEALQAYVANCDSNVPADADPEERSAECWGYVRLIARHFAGWKQMTEVDVRPALELLVAAGRGQPRDLDSWLADLRRIEALDKDMADRELRRMATAADIPLHTRRKAALSVVDSLKAKKPLEAVAWIDCAIRIYAEKPPPFPEDGWQQLVSRSQKPFAENDRDCTMDPSTPPCAIAPMSNRIYVAMSAREWAIARQSVEQLGAWTLEHDLPVYYVALAIKLFGEEQLRQRLEEGRAAIEFALLLQPHLKVDEWFKEMVFSPAHETAMPWKSPTESLKPLPVVCP